MKVAVFGARGYIGSRMCARLKEAGDEVFARSSSDGWIDSETGVVNPDLTVPPGLDALYYFAQSPHYRQGPAMLWHCSAVNVTAPVRLAALLAETNPGARFIYLSTGTVYRSSFEPLSESAPLNRANGYALSKIQAEEMLALFSPILDVTCVRLFGVYGPDQTDKLVSNLLKSILAGRPVTFQPRAGIAGDREGLRISLCHVEDAIAILRSLVEIRDLPVVNVGAANSVSIMEIASALASALGRALCIEEQSSPRTGDLIADVGKLGRYLPPPVVDIRKVAIELVAPSS
ncbi:MAG: NAD(P)-dependent oxidoreductase [Rhodospirillaceae bacterium]